MDSAAWNERYSGTELVWTAEPNRFLVREVTGLPPGRALDVACGEGRNAVWLAREGWRVTAVDFSAVGIDKGRTLAERAGIDVEWIVGDVTTYQPARAAFDLVAVLYLQLPRAALHVALAAAASALAPRGTLLVIGHDSTNLTEGYGGPKDPAVLYAPDDVVDALPDLTIEKAERVRRTVETDDGPRDAIDVLVRARA